MKNLTGALVRALTAAGVPAVSAYLEKTPVLPLACVAREEDKTLLRADGREFAAEQTYALRLFAESGAALDSLEEQADQTLADLGFSRVAALRGYDEALGAHTLEARYRAVVRGDMAYQ
jgi:hypothetical protein